MSKLFEHRVLSKLPLMEKRRGAIYGAGKLGGDIYELLYRICDIRTFVDRSVAGIGDSFKGVALLKPEELTALSLDFVFIASERYKQEILAYLIELYCDHLSPPIFLSLDVQQEFSSALLKAEESEALVRSLVFEYPDFALAWQKISKLDSEHSDVYQRCYQILSRS